MVWPRQKDARGENTKINYGMNARVEKKKWTSEMNVDGRSTSSHDNKKFRKRSKEKRRGMAFGLWETATVVIELDRQILIIKSLYIFRALLAHPPNYTASRSTTYFEQYVNKGFLCCRHVRIYISRHTHKKIRNLIDVHSNRRILSHPAMTNLRFVQAGRNRFASV
jgi:hypothetical protein